MVQCYRSIIKILRIFHCVGHPRDRKKERPKWEIIKTQEKKHPTVFAKKNFWFNVLDFQNDENTDVNFVKNWSIFWSIIDFWTLMLPCNVRWKIWNLFPWWCNWSKKKRKKKPEFLIKIFFDSPFLTRKWPKWCSHFGP